jgi:hypothetical protein
MENNISRYLNGKIHKKIKKLNIIHEDGVIHIILSFLVSGIFFNSCTTYSDAFLVNVYDSDKSFEDISRMICMCVNTCCFDGYFDGNILPIVHESEFDYESNYTLHHVLKVKEVCHPNNRCDLTFLIIVENYEENYETAVGLIFTTQDTPFKIAEKLAQTEIVYCAKSVAVNALTKKEFARRWIKGVGGGRGYMRKDTLRVFTNPAKNQLTYYHTERSFEIEWIQKKWGERKKRGCDLEKDCQCYECLAVNDFL